MPCDEKWSCVEKKQKNRAPDDPADAHGGDCWDHVALDPEHRLVRAVVPGARTIENTEAVVHKVKERWRKRTPELITTDDSGAEELALVQVFGVPVDAPPRPGPGPGRPRILPQCEVPKGWTSATVRKRRAGNRVVSVERKLVFGTEPSRNQALRRSKVSSAVNTSWRERRNGTDRGRKARKARKTYRCSKDWEIHESLTDFTLDSYNFCWAVRTLRVQGRNGKWQQRSPAMAAN